MSYVKANTDGRWREELGLSDLGKLWLAADIKREETWVD
jgi:hypothetical protein